MSSVSWTVSKPACFEQSSLVLQQPCTCLVYCVLAQERLTTLLTEQPRGRDDLRNDLSHCFLRLHTVKQTLMITWNSWNAYFFTEHAPCLCEISGCYKLYLSVSHSDTVLTSHSAAAMALRAHWEHRHPEVESLGASKCTGGVCLFGCWVQITAIFAKRQSLRLRVDNNL